MVSRNLVWLALLGIMSSCAPAQVQPVALPARPIAVTVDSPASVGLYERDTALQQPGVAPPAPVVLCQSPCTASVEWRPTKTWWVEGKSGEMEAAEVELSPGQDVTVSIDPGDPTLDLVGTAMAFGAGISVLTGAMILLIHDGVSDGPFRADDPAVITAGVFGGLGLASLAVGIPLMVAYDSRVDVAPARGAKARAPRYWLGEF